MPSERPRTVPRMGSFKRALFGYRRPDVDAAISARNGRIGILERKAAECERRVESIDELEREVTTLSGMVIEREREIRGLTERLREANERHDRSIASLDAVSGRLEEIQAQARGQATRKVHPDDARSWLISLTPSGRRAMARISALRRERYSEWVADWSSGDIDMFGALLERFNDALARSAPPPEAEQAQGRRVDHRQSVVTPRRTR